MKEKLAKLKEILKEENEEFLFLDFEDPHHFWLLEQKLENSFIIVKRRGKPELLMSSLESFENKDFIIKPLKKENFPNKAVVNKDCYKVKYDKLIKPKPLDIFVRRSKDEHEVSKIKIACEFTNKCFLEIVKGLKNKKYKKEKEVEKEIRIFAAKNNLEIAFDPIVASQKNAAVPHHNNLGVLRKGFLILDFGFKYKGYCSDMTRTVYLGKPTKKEQEIYDLVLKTQLDSIKNCKENVSLKLLDENARKTLGSLAEKFIHSLGHGIGIRVHEEPFFKENEKLKKGDIVTIEPGVYEKEKYGIRIEDTILITNKDAKILTKSTKKLIEIK